MSTATAQTPPAAAGQAWTKGLRSLHDETPACTLALEGELPTWLAGSLLRTGPAKFEVGSQTMRHWFDGLAMLHRFGIEHGAVTYAGRFLRSNSYDATDDGRIAYAEFATDPCRSIFKRVQSTFAPALSDNGNVNVCALGERFIAMTETPLPVEFDAATLRSAGVHPYVAPGQLSTAHPHADRATGAMLNYAARLGPRSSYRFFSVEGESGEPRVLAKLPVSRPAYMHSFGLTERYFVLAEFPLVVNPIELALARRPYIENYRWRPERGTRFTLVDRDTGAATTGFRGEAAFAFHHINAFETDRGEVIVDLCAYDDPAIIRSLYLDRLRRGEAVTPARPVRYTLSLDDRSVSRVELGDGELELPRINYGRCNGRRYRYAWGNGNAGDWLGSIVKLDVQTGERRAWSSPGCWAGEPVFVAQPGGADEDDGVLLSVVLDADAERSFLLVLDAATLDERARAVAPVAIPYGFHGQFARSSRS